MQIKSVIEYWISFSEHTFTYQYKLNMGRLCCQSGQPLRWHPVPCSARQWGRAPWCRNRQKHRPQLQPVFLSSPRRQSRHWALRYRRKWGQRWESWQLRVVVKCALCYSNNQCNISEFISNAIHSRCLCKVDMVMAVRFSNIWI